MINVEVWLVDGNESKTKRIRVSGHSYYDDPGKDIVCSSVSTSTILTANLIEELCPEYKITNDEDNAIIDIQVLCDDLVSIKIMNNLYKSIIELKTQFPKYIKLGTKIL
jgi:uncharacterized protein YsxB (DUF464 family)